ncbi:hypothetical protein KRE47_03285 [Elizabethkingia meningoseptica]|uniref:hypothetical protein n=2 Tax=Elizabethkingia meningoseptica TaxID=238 RepID=UPI0023B0F8D9|nr:hypothetical protein [Elizabethkingia meningoseptica]MDE5466797.1 hypothetical protein [Elizabethkingia meningoseptica]MDE5477406.1 hypothetical protein [Elizabethkingia meningoseptica]MDE5500806.1 hypothetical protein [Elizabethkingia meningoseptica]
MVLRFFFIKHVLRAYQNVPLMFLGLLLLSCTSYSKYASYNSIPEKTEAYRGDQYFKYEGSRFNGNYYRYTNDSLKVTMLLFGAYINAHDKKMYKKILKSKEFTDVVSFPSHNKLLYAFTTYHNKAMQFKAFIDLSVGRKRSYPKGYYTKTIECDKKNKVTLTIIDKFDTNGALFLMDNFKCIE